tara:strand:+ start:1190 stop:1840 length:651 start_codon:yes stop_codon:yes gene_type:complete
MSLRKIIIYGTLRKFCGQSSFEAVINKPKDVFSFLKANFPDLESHMGNQLYKIKVNGKTLDNPDINMRGDIQVIPLVIGAGNTVKNIFKFAIGIAIYYYTGGFAGLGIGAQQSIIGNKLISGIVQTIGATMAMSGAAALLGGGQNYNNPQDQNLSDPNLRASYSFNNISNVVAAGTPIPIIYGEILCGSIVISSGVDTLQVRRDIKGSQPFSSEVF